MASRAKQGNRTSIAGRRAGRKSTGRSKKMGGGRRGSGAKGKRGSSRSGGGDG